MAYVKLDTGLLDSTLWTDRDGREVFLTALLMALPHEVLEPTPELAVRSLDETGFVVPPGWYGRVPAAGVGIIRRAGVGIEEGLDALERLAAPDPESRTPDFDGRRLVRVDGGYIVLNFMKYRDRDTTAAERQQRYRDRHKGRNAVTSKSNAVTERNVTQRNAVVSSKKEEVSRKQEVLPTTGMSKRESTTVNDQQDQFVTFWRIYPKRAGGNPKLAALKAWEARIRSGVLPEQMLAGAERYATYCRMTGREHTEFVKQAASFLGPNEHWNEPWEIPVSKGELRATATTTLLQDWVNNGE